ncbi:MAG: type III polyketide synthase, partial [Planctomycetales bacterium]|nr:type III polyketide synthase [Planctomycetales bacterium]
SSWRLVDNWSTLLPDTADWMTWRIGDHGFQMSLSPKAPELIESQLPELLAPWLNRHGIGADDVKCWAIHPGGPRILDACESALRLAPTALAASRETLANCGNMSSPTLLFVLDELQRRGAETPCVALAFGPGLAIEAALLG